MDILTHAGIAVIGAAPLLGSHPEIAVSFAAGSVLPDLDALSRIFGKRAFLSLHQTWSHAIPVQAALSVLAGGLAQSIGLNGLQFGLGLFVGLAFHTFLDLTNTLGVTVLAPISRKRFCLEWVFFIDAVVLGLTLVALSLSILDFFRRGEGAAWVSLIFFTVLAVYIATKGSLRLRAGSFAQDAISLMPSALWPLRFFGVVDAKSRVELFQINAVTGSRSLLGEQQVFDDIYAPLLAEIPEFRLMKSLSPAYHVVGVTKTDAGERVRCRDLRTRNFATTFGDLEALIPPGKPVKLIEFHV